VSLTRCGPIEDGLRDVRGEIAEAEEPRDRSKRLRDRLRCSVQEPEPWYGRYGTARRWRFGRASSLRSTHNPNMQQRVLANGRMLWGRRRQSIAFCDHNSRYRQPTSQWPRGAVNFAVGGLLIERSYLSILRQSSGARRRESCC